MQDFKSLCDTRIHGEAHKLSHTLQGYLLAYTWIAESRICLYKVHFKSDPELHTVKNSVGLT